MTTREEIQYLMAYMAMCFPNFHPILNGQPNAIDVYLDLLGDMSLDTLTTAVRACCAEPGRAFAPSPGEIRGAATQMHAQAAGLPTAGEAWGAIMESFRRTSFNQPDLLEHPLVKEALRCMGGKDIIGMSENLPAERARFLQFYDELKEKTMANEAMLPQVAAYIEERKRIEGGIKLLADNLSHPKFEVTNELL